MAGEVVLPSMFTATGFSRSTLDESKSGMECFISLDKICIPTSPRAVRIWLAVPLGLAPIEVMMQSTRVKYLSCGAKTWHQPTFCEWSAAVHEVARDVHRAAAVAVDDPG